MTLDLSFFEIQIVLEIRNFSLDYWTILWALNIVVQNLYETILNIILILVFENYEEFTKSFQSDLNVNSNLPKYRLILARMNSHMILIQDNREPLWKQFGVFKCPISKTIWGYIFKIRLIINILNVVENTFFNPESF